MMTFEDWIDAIDDAVYLFLTEFDENYECEIGADFCAYPLDGIIEWSLLYVENGGKEFYENFVSRFPKAEGFNLFTLSILHEIGHLETVAHYECDTEIRKRTVNSEDYFKLHNEVIATNWAGEWINNNYDYAVATDKFFTQLLNDCYADLITE